MREAKVKKQEEDVARALLKRKREEEQEKGSLRKQKEAMDRRQSVGGTANDYSSEHSVAQLQEPSKNSKRVVSPDPADRDSGEYYTTAKGVSSRHGDSGGEKRRRPPSVREEQERQATKQSHADSQADGTYGRSHRKRQQEYQYSDLDLEPALTFGQVQSFFEQEEERDELRALRREKASREKAIRIQALFQHSRRK